MKLPLRTPIALLCCLGALLVAHAAPPTGGKTTSKPRSQQFGQFVLNNVDGDTDVYFKPGQGTKIVLRGENLSVTSARYDIAAPKIVLLGKKAVPTNADATGGVRIAIRNPEDQQDTTMTADTGQYVGPSAGKNAFIYATGNVHTVTRTPDLSPDGPLVMDSRKATVELLPDGGYNIKFDGIKGSGIPLEKPATPKRNP